MVNSLASSSDDRFIKAGSLVITFIARDRTPIPVTVTPGEQLNNSYGSFFHNDMIGLPYGSKMVARNRRGFIYLLRPTPELWTISLPHRTQILYAPDMSFITLKLSLSPGCRVIEAGTGSGSFTHVLARTVGRRSKNGDPSLRTGQVPKNWGGLPNSIQAPSRGTPSAAEEEKATPTPSGVETPTTEADGSSRGLQSVDSATVPEFDGRVWSFEFHAGRAEKARQELTAHGMDDVVKLSHRNVCKNGFGLEDAADAIFLDLPAPWEAIPHAPSALRANSIGRICCFSPCIEQVLKTVTALTEQGFTDIQTYESLVRTHESLAGQGPEMDVGDAIRRIKEVERRKEERRIQQIEKTRKEREAKEGSVTEPKTSSDTANFVKLDEGGRDQADEEPDMKKRKRQEEMEEVEGSTHREAETQEGVADDLAEEVETGEDHSPLTSSSSNKPKARNELLMTKKKARQAILLQEKKGNFQPATTLSRPYWEMRGHTSYLTFATLLPRDISATSRT